MTDKVPHPPLLPCPFCGQHAMLDHHRGFVTCDECQITVDDRRWNRRAQDAEADRRDAERYRWLREQHDGGHEVYVTNILDEADWRLLKLDYAIDNEMDAALAASSNRTTEKGNG